MGGFHAPHIQLGQNMAEAIVSEAQHGIANNRVVLGGRVINRQIVQALHHDHVQVHVNAAVSIQCQQSQEIGDVLVQIARLEQMVLQQPFFGRRSSAVRAKVDVAQMHVRVRLQQLDERRRRNARVIPEATRRREQHENVPVGMGAGGRLDGAALPGRNALQKKLTEDVEKCAKYPRKAQKSN